MIDNFNHLHSGLIAFWSGDAQDINTCSSKSLWIEECSRDKNLEIPKEDFWSEWYGDKY